jgi:hypothetical protein
VYEHDTVFQLLGAVVGFAIFAVKVRETNEMRGKNGAFMRMNFLRRLVGQFV